MSREICGECGDEVREVTCCTSFQNRMDDFAPVMVEPLPDPAVALAEALGEENARLSATIERVRDVLDRSGRSEDASTLVFLVMEALEGEQQ